MTIIAGNILPGSYLSHLAWCGQSFKQESESQPKVARISDREREREAKKKLSKDAFSQEMMKKGTELPLAASSVDGRLSLDDAAIDERLEIVVSQMKSYGEFQQKPPASSISESPSGPSTPPRTEKKSDSFEPVPTASLSGMAASAFAFRSEGLNADCLKEIDSASPDILTSIEAGIDSMKDYESRNGAKFGALKDEGSSNFTCALLLLFLMNLVIGTTRILLFWKWKDTKSWMYLTKTFAQAQLSNDWGILKNFFSLFVGGRLSVYKPIPNDAFSVGLQDAITKFKRNSFKWFVKVLGSQQMHSMVKEFTDQLDLYIFGNYLNGELLGLASIWGNFLFISDHLANNPKRISEVLQHEMVHNFFRFFLLRTGVSANEAALMISPDRFDRIQYRGNPIHSGYLYDFIFSGIPISDKKISPFSLLLEDEELC